MDTLTWSLTILTLGILDQYFPLGSSLAELRLAGSEKCLQKRNYIINNSEPTSPTKTFLSFSEGRIHCVHVWLELLIIKVMLKFFTSNAISLFFHLPSKFFHTHNFVLSHWAISGVHYLCICSEPLKLGQYSCCLPLGFFRFVPINISL